MNLLLLAACLGLALPAAAQQQSAVPSLWPVKQKLQRPDLTKILTIRFLTETTYPPFNYVDESGDLVGFNVDLAREICNVLKVRCIMRTRPFEKLFDELAAGTGDAIIASIRSTPISRQAMDFSDRYYLTPARFAAKSSTQIDEITPDSIAAWTVAVVKGSAHQAYLAAFFTMTKTIAFDTRDAAQIALREGKVDALFDDGIATAFWLNGAGSQDCCAFRGGPFLESRYFGEGVGIAVAKGNDRLRVALNFALRQVYLDGTYEELFLRHFPVSFY